MFKHVALAYGHRISRLGKASTPVPRTTYSLARRAKLLDVLVFRDREFIFCFQSDGEKATTTLNRMRKARIPEVSGSKDSLTGQQRAYAPLAVPSHRI